MSTHATCLLQQGRISKGCDGQQTMSSADKNLLRKSDGKAVLSNLFHSEVAGCCCKTEAFKQPLAVIAEAASTEAPDADLGKMQPFFFF